MVDAGAPIPGLGGQAKGWLKARERLIQYAPPDHHIEKMPGGRWVVRADSAAPAVEEAAPAKAKPTKGKGKGKGWVKNRRR